MSKVMINFIGTKRYYNDDGQLHRDDGPAWIRVDGEMHWYQNGKQLDDHQPSTKWSNGCNIWYYNDLLFRKNGPAIDYPNGYKEWYLGGSQWPTL